MKIFAMTQSSTHADQEFKMEEYKMVLKKTNTENLKGGACTCIYMPSCSAQQPTHSGFNISKTLVLQ